MLHDLLKLVAPEYEASSLSGMLGFHNISSNGEIHNKNGGASVMVELVGIDVSAKTTQEIAELMDAKRRWLNSIAEHDVAFKIISIREEQAFTDNKQYSNTTLDAISKTWMKQFDRSFSGSHIIVFTVNPDKKLGRGMVNTEVLHEVVSKTLDMLDVFKPSKLTPNNKSMFQALSYLINGESFQLNGFESNTVKKLCKNHVHFDSKQGVIEFSEGTNAIFAGVVAVSAWGDIASPRLMGSILSLPIQLAVVSQYKGVNSIKAQLELVHQKKQANIIITSEQKTAEFDKAIELVESGESSLYQCEQYIVVYAASAQVLTDNVNQIKRIYYAVGVLPVVQNRSIEMHYRSMLPGVDFMVNKTQLLSHQIAHMLDFSCDETSFEGSDWGSSPVQYFKTRRAGKYGLQLHESDKNEALAHSLIIAPAGSGKTTLFQHIICGALAYSNLRAIILDRFHGTEIFTKSCGGMYVDLVNDAKLNPFTLDETPNNLAYLFDLVQDMANCHDEESKFHIQKMLSLIYTLPANNRVLSNLIDSIVPPSSSLYQPLQKWLGGNIQGGFFNGVDSEGMAFDSLDFAKHQLMTFEMGQIFDNPELASIVVGYLMYRLRAEVKESVSPHLVFIDETAPMLQSESFKRHVKVLFNEHRKLRGSINVCFQTASALHQSGISQVILSQCPNKFLFPDINANYEDYEGFGLTEFEWSYIKKQNESTKSLKHSVLLKRAEQSVILNTDMSGLGQYLKLYRSGIESVRYFRDMTTKHTGDECIKAYLSSSL